MLLNGGQLHGERILSAQTVAFMHLNHLGPDVQPETAELALPGYGFGLGSRVLLDPAQAGLLGSVGEYGWAGAAKTYYWI